jgi:hypothetical protein
MQEKAFPNPHLTNETGMTMRDYFAAKAMQGMYARVNWHCADVARKAYELADAMMEARRAK